MGMNDEQAALLGRWARLSEKQKEIVLEIMGEFGKEYGKSK